MSNKVNEALFDLVKSLSKSEKRYFKLLSSRHTIGEENNYIRLFDYLDNMESYDEDQLFQDFEGEAFLNRFSITKKRLYDHILSALDAYYTGSSMEAQLYKMLHSVDILFEKSLYDQSRRVLNSASKLAAKNELCEIQLIIEEKKKRLIETQGYSECKDKEVKATTETIRKVADLVLNQNELWEIKSELFERLSTRGVARSEMEVEDYNKICEPLEKISGDRLTTEGKYLLHHTLSAYHFATGAMESSLKELRKNYKLLEENEGSDKIEINRQISMLTNAIYIADKIGAYKEAFGYLSKMKQIANSPVASEDIQIKLFSSISSIEISMYLRKGEFERASDYSNEIGSKLVGYREKLTPTRHAFLCFKLAVTKIGMGEFNDALKWINEILNDNRLDKTEDIIGFTQLLDLLVHMELHHDNLLPYSLKSVQRFFKTRNRMYTFERVLLQFISKLIKCKDRFEAEELWGDLYQELTRITNDDVFESVALDYFDFQSWAESKLTRKSFDSIVREKYNQQMRTAS